LRPGSNIKTRRFEFTPETAVYVMFSSRKWAGRLFQTRGPATAKLLSPNVLCVCVERHTICRWKSVAAVDDFRRPDVCRRRGTVCYRPAACRKPTLFATQVSKFG